MYSSQTIAHNPLHTVRIHSWNTNGSGFSACTPAGCGQGTRPNIPAGWTQQRLQHPLGHRLSGRTSVWHSRWVHQPHHDGVGIQSRPCFRLSLSSCSPLAWATIQVSPRFNADTQAQDPMLQIACHYRRQGANANDSLVSYSLSSPGILERKQVVIPCLERVHSVLKRDRTTSLSSSDKMKTSDQKMPLPVLSSLW